MKRSIDEILDESIETLRAGTSLEDVLRAYPGEALELVPLLNLAIELEELPAPHPTVQGLMRAMARSVAGEEPRRERKGRLLFFPSPLLARVAASVALIFILGWGATVASSNTTPGDLLYPVKRLSERVKFALTLDGENRAELRIVFSEKRLTEAVKKYARGEGLDEDLLSTMLEEARLAIEAAGELPAADRDRLLARAQSAGAYQTKVLTDIKARAPEEDQEQIGRWVERCQSRWQWSCGVKAPPDADNADGAATPAEWRDVCKQNCPTW